MIVSSIKDEEKIREALLRPGVVYSCLPDDVDPEDALQTLLSKPDVTFIGVFNRDRYLGCFVVIEAFDVVEVHTCLLRSCFGVNAIRAGLKCKRWIRSNIGKPIVSLIPEYNRLAIKFTENMGLVPMGKYGKWKKDGVDYACIVYGEIA